MAWTSRMHLMNPTVNTTTEAEKDLALAVARAICGGRKDGVSIMAQWKRQ